MGLNPINIKARDLPDAWFQCVDACLEHGRQWTVEQGSYKGQKRWELDYITVHITHPGTRPLVPEMPPHLSEVPPPTTMEYVEEYLPYLMTSDIKPNEWYTYGERLAGRHIPQQYPGCLSKEFVAGLGSQIEAVVNKFKKSRGTNQCSMSVAMPSDIHLKDPPCLREIDCRIFSSEALPSTESPALHFFVYFRSWDLWNGFPANLAAIRLMQEHMSDEIGIEAGEIIASSKGLHIYDHAWNLAELRVK